MNRHRLSACLLAVLLTAGALVWDQSWKRWPSATSDSGDRDAVSSPELNPADRTIGGIDGLVFEDETAGPLLEAPSDTEAFLTNWPRSAPSSPANQESSPNQLSPTPQFAPQSAGNSPDAHHSFNELPDPHRAGGAGRGAWLSGTIEDVRSDRDAYQNDRAAYQNGSEPPLYRR